MPDEPALFDRMLPHLQLTVTGLYANQHDRWLEFLYDTTRRYNDDPSDPVSPSNPLTQAPRSFSGAHRHPALRAVPSIAAKDGYAVVQDFDITTKWKLPNASSDAGFQRVAASAHELLF